MRETFDAASRLDPCGQHATHPMAMSSKSLSPSDCGSPAPLM